MGVQLDIDVFEFKLLETHELETNADIENKAQNVDKMAGNTVTLSKANNVKKARA